MRKVLAITVALMIAAIVLMPALGYTNQAAGNQSYTAKTGNQVEHSFTTNAPAHNLTPDMVANKFSFKSAAVQSTRMPYSFKQGAATPYSIKLVGVEKTVAPPVAEPVAAPVVLPKFSIEGMVVDDNQTGLVGWTINLSKDGAVINSVPTAADGKFAFAGLAAGEYTVSEVLMQGWSIISPVEGKSVVTITDANKIDLVFVNQLVPVVVPPVVLENVTAPANDTAPLGNATAAINATG